MRCGRMWRRVRYGSSAMVAAAIAAAGVLASCGESDSNKAAYQACLASGKRPASRVANAQLAGIDKATFGLMQDSSISVNIPYTLDGRNGVLQCSVLKQQDGSLKNQFE